MSSCIPFSSVRVVLQSGLMWPWPPDVKNQLIRKNPDAGKDWRQEDKGMTEDEMVGWHHRLNGHEFEQAPGDGEGQRSLVCYSPWGRKESDMTKRLNNNNWCCQVLSTGLIGYKPACHPSLSSHQLWDLGWVLNPKGPQHSQQEKLKTTEVDYLFQQFCKSRRVYSCCHS